MSESTRMMLGLVIGIAIMIVLVMKTRYIHLLHYCSQH